MAPHFSTLAWKIPWTEEPGGLQSMGSLRVGHDWVTSLSLSCIGEGNGNPLKCSCLKNPRDGGAWWAAVYGVTQSRTQLKRLSVHEQKWKRERRVRHGQKHCRSHITWCSWMKVAHKLIICVAWCWERLRAGEGGNRGWNGWLASLSLSKLQEMVKDREARHAAVHVIRVRHNLVTEQRQQKEESWSYLSIFRKNGSKKGYLLVITRSSKP